jgi:hypothetical protein
LKIKRITIILAVYFLLVLLFSFEIGGPYLEGKYSNLHASADSITYIKLAKQNDIPLVSVGGNLLGPTIILRLLNFNNFLVVLLNCFLFYTSFFLAIKYFNLNKLKFLLLLIINPLIFLSLTTINKEILGLFLSVVLVCYLKTNNKIFLFITLSMALFTRWEQFAVIIVFLLLKKFNFLTRKRLLMVVLIVAALTILYPSFLLHQVELIYGNGKLNDVNSLGTIHYLNALQAHYMFFIVLIPKLLLNYFGDIIKIFITFPNWTDIYNTYGILGAGFCFLLILIKLIKQRKLKLKDDRIYFCVIMSVMYTMMPIVQLRYFFPLYIIMCIIASERNIKSKFAKKEICNEYILKTS